MPSKVQEKPDSCYNTNSSPFVIPSNATLPLPFFLDEKGPKNHGDEDHFEAIIGLVTVFSETRSSVAQTSENTAAPVAGWQVKWSSRPDHHRVAYTIDR